jgi:hypothetical protein
VDTQWSPGEKFDETRTPLFGECRRKTSVEKGILWWVQYARGRHDLALLGYLKASELGYEVAQVNVAWLLSQNQGIPVGQSAISYVQPGETPPPSLHANFFFIFFFIFIWFLYLFCFYCIQLFVLNYFY